MIDEALKEVRNMLLSSMGTSVVAADSFYCGDVGLNYKNSLPAVVVRELFTEHDRPSTAKDRYRFGISILVITDMTKDFHTSGLTDGVVKHRETLRKLVEEADTDGAPKTTTVLGALMKQANLRGTAYTYNLNGRVDYRPPAPREFFYTAAEITLELVTEMVTRKP